MARVRLKIDIVGAINELTTDRSKRIAYKAVMSQDEAKRELGRRVIDAIVSRTLSGKDKDGDRFVKYSDAYKKSLAFRIYGKSPSKVDLKLTGAMQAAIQVVGTTSRSVEIGIVDQTESDKASGHIEGANNLPVRDFWGITDEEKAKILKNTIQDFAGSQVQDIINEATSGIDLTVTPSGTGTEIDIDLEG